MAKLELLWKFSKFWQKQDYQMINSLENLEKKLGYAFDKKDLLKKALTHISKSDENNETLEFLGDAVINLSISDLIIKNFPNDDEGTLSLMRSKLVSRDTLNKIGKEIKLNEFIICGESFKNQALPENILGNALEAIFGAIYQEKGFETSKKIVANLFTKKIELIIPEDLKNTKNILQEYCQKNGLGLPSYNQILKIEKKDSFSVVCKMNEDLYSIGYGKKLKLAEQDAALKLLKQIGILDE